MLMMLFPLVYYVLVYPKCMISIHYTSIPHVSHYLWCNVYTYIQVYHYDHSQVKWITSLQHGACYWMENTRQQVLMLNASYIITGDKCRNTGQVPVFKYVRKLPMWWLNRASPKYVYRNVAMEETVVNWQQGHARARFIDAIITGFERRVIE